MKNTTDLPDHLRRDNPRERHEKRFKFRRVNEITGVFVLLIIAGLIAAVLFTGRSQRWFKTTATIEIVLPEAGAAGIRQGSEVYFLGTLVGSVSDVIVEPTGRMKAEARIRHDFFRFVRVDSYAAVKKRFGVAGDSFFEITRGVGQPLPEKGASIICNEQFQSVMETAIEEIHRETLLVLSKTSAGLDTWTQLGTELGETRRHLHELTVRVERMAAGMEAGEGTVGKLLTDTALVDDAQHLFGRAHQTMNDLQQVVTNLNVAIRNVQSGTARLPEITDALADEANDLPGLVKQTQTSMREMEELILAMQTHWLLRKYVRQTNSSSARGVTDGLAPKMRR